jgi:hypothetical protein
MATILDLNPRLEAARQARAHRGALVSELVDLAVANFRLALLPLLVIADEIGGAGQEDRSSPR